MRRPPPPVRALKPASGGLLAQGPAQAPSCRRSGESAPPVRHWRAVPVAARTPDAPLLAGPPGARPDGSPVRERVPGSRSTSTVPRRPRPAQAEWPWQRPEPPPQAQVRAPARQRLAHCSSAACATPPPRPARPLVSRVSGPRSRRQRPGTGSTGRCPGRRGGHATRPSAGAIRACRSRRWPLRPLPRPRARSCCDQCSKRRNPAPPGCVGAETEGLPSIGFAAWWLPLTTGSRS